MLNRFILIASVLAGVALAWAFSLPVATMIFAASPGGLAEITISAQVLHISVPLVLASLVPGRHSKDGDSTYPRMDTGPFNRAPAAIRKSAPSIGR